MGTNFYLRSKSAMWRKRFGEKASTDDCPPRTWEAHIAKTSYGWLPLFEQHPAAGIYSVRDLKAIYDEGGGDGGIFTIVDEYNATYSWGEFEKRVINFGSPKSWNPTGGYYDGNWRSEQDNDCRAPYNHWENEYRDQDGYRFQLSDFC